VHRLSHSHDSGKATSSSLEDCVSELTEHPTSCQSSKAAAAKNVELIVLARKRPPPFAWRRRSDGAGSRGPLRGPLGSTHKNAPMVYIGANALSVPDGWPPPSRPLATKSDFRK
jgi:hypothetical protein